MSINSKANLPVQSYDSLFGLFQCYLDSFEEEIPESEYIDVYEKDEYLFDLFTKTNKYLGENLYVLSDTLASEGTETVKRNIANGTNTFNPFTDIPDGVSLSTPLSSTNLASAGGTAGTGLDNADILWQFVDNTVEGAWLKRSDEEYVTATACIKLESGYNEFRFPYPNKGLSSEGLSWTGKGIDNCTITSYLSQDDQINAQLVEDIYWEDTTATSAVSNISLYRTNIIEAGATASKNINNADQILVKDSRGSEVSEFAWLYEFDHTELPITCGTNSIHFPLFSSAGENGSTFNISPDQSEDIKLIDVNVTESMTGAVAGLEPKYADWIIKKTGACGAPSEGAWLRGKNNIALSGSNPNPVSNGSIQVGMNAVFPAGKPTPFVWQFESIEATEAMNGFDHDDYCEYKKLNSYNSIINPEVGDDVDEWKQCNCKAVFYSPIGNPLKDFENYKGYHDIIYEDMGDDPFSYTSWLDSTGVDYTQSNNFGVFHYSGDEPDVGYGIGYWECPNGSPFILQEGKAYVYIRASFGDCADHKPPCFVINSRKCVAGCDEVVWYKMVLNNDGEWESLDVKSDMILESSQHYEYIKRGEMPYQLDVGGEELLDRYTPTPSFSLNIPLNRTKPYWAESTNVRGYETGVSPRETDAYLLTTQPVPSSIILTDDMYVRYNRLGCDPIEWREDLEFTVDLQLPDIWKKIEIKHESPVLLQKIIGCGSCELSFASDPKTCSVKQNNCNVSFTTVTATEEDSDMILRTPSNCDGITEIFYNSQTTFEWEEEFRVITTTTTSTEDVATFAEAESPWGNLLNAENAELKIHEKDATLKTKKEIGVFSPNHLGLFKIECFNIQNTINTNNV